MKNNKWKRYLRVTLGAVCIGSFVSPSNATILTFSTDNAKVKVYTTMDAIQDYGSNVVVDSVVSGAYTYYYEMGNGWTPDVTVRYSTESPTDFPEYYGNSDGDAVWPGVLFLWSHIFTGGTAIPSSIPTGYEYYVTFTPSAANTGVVINSFVLNDYVGYTAPGSPPQEVQWRVAKGSPSGALLASGSATLQDGEVSTISTGMSAAQASLQPLVLVIKRMGGTEDDLAVDDINFDQTEIIPPTVYNNAVRASNPKYYWTFDEAGLGNAREQMSGNAADMFTPSGASAKAPSTTTTGNVSLGQALALDRTATSVWNTGDLSGPAFTGAFAYEVWINSADPDQYNYILGSNAGNGFNTGTIAQFSAFADDPGTPHIMLFTLSHPPHSFNFDSALQSSGWHHWVFVTKTPEQGTDVYKNGALLGTYANGSVIAPFPATELRAGGWSPSASAENFTGQIDELAIYDLASLDAVALAAKGQEIASHYHAVAGVPSIGTQPRNETASPGSNVTFTVVASGGLLTYQWQKFGGATWENIAGSTSASLVFNAVTSANSGQYRVQITNAAGSADSQSVTLDIVSPPTVYNNAVRASNPKYYWTFDEAGLGNAREQMSGNAADVFMPSGASAKAPSTTTTGNVSLGQALALDRTATSVWNTGDLSGPAFTGAFAYEVWINSADPDQYNYILGSNAGNGFNTASILQFSNFAPDAGTAHIFVYPAWPGDTSTALQAAGWNHWVFVSKPNGGGSDVYKNGAFLGPFQEGLTINAFPATELRAGGWSPSASAENFTGQIDELAIYDLGSLDAVALAAKGQEIASHYQVGNTAPSLECTNVLRDPTNGQLTLTWTSQPGKTYRLNSSTDLVDFTTVIADNIPSGGASTTYGPFAGPIPTGFFRVREN